MTSVPLRLTVFAIAALAIAEQAVITRPALTAGMHAADAGETLEALPEVVLNDNRRTAGSLRAGVLTLRLRAGAGVWKPEGPSGRELRIEAFGEEGVPLSVPAPMVRVPEGTNIDVSVRNELETPLRVGGFCERGGVTCTPLDVPPHETRQVRFTTGPAGTYHYWGSSSGMPLGFRAVEDAQLSGAFIVDPASAPPAEDRVLVITEWTSVTREQLRQVAQAADPGVAFIGLKPSILTTINGRVWPFTERLSCEVGEQVRWRVVNLSTQMHPMHLHGFYFDVESVGDGMRDTPHGPGQVPHVVTQLMQPGGTMTMRWVPERAGNWLFHCHVMLHVSPATRHRLRLINITPNDILVVSLQTNKGPVMWRPLTKDGAMVPAERDRPEAASQMIAVGETYDFEYDAPAGRQHLWLEVRTPAGRWEMQGHVIVK
jgi:FtsP/CotA-like multicopper oxidase with cupredoxin domain